MNTKDINAMLEEQREPVVEFYSFYRDGTDREMASIIATAFMSNVDAEDLQYTENTVYTDEYKTILVSGLFAQSCLTRSHRDSIIAYGFADYASRSNGILELSIYEYRALLELKEQLEDRIECHPGDTIRLRLLQQQLDVVVGTIKQFKYHYAKKNPGFLFDLLKNA
jgi:hypothetical protein